jgi:phosphonate degradation associated HDIG domain protein
MTTTAQNNDSLNNDNLNKDSLDKENIIPFISNIFNRLGADSYLGEAVSMTEHMLQTAHNAEKAGESDATITAALLHDIGHYTGEFPENYIDLGLNNKHESMGAAILEKFFPTEVTEPVRWHVEAKRYLCAIEESYFSGLSEASVKTLELQGGPLDGKAVKTFASNPHLETIVRVRRYDDGGKVPGTKTPDLSHFLEIAQSILDQQPEN